MTKQEYLKSKGYIYNSEEHCYKKTYSFENDGNIKYLVIGYIDLKYSVFYLYPDSIDNQEDIDNLQIAFNNLKRDFEEVQNYE